MRWKNVKIFGLKELVPSPLVLIILFMVIVIIILFAIWMQYDQPVNIPGEVQEVFEESPLQEPEENVTSIINEEEEDAKFYSVNTYFFSSDCVFRYNSLIDDLEDLKAQRLNQGSSSEKLQQIESYLSRVRQELRIIIMDCTR